MKVEKSPTRSSSFNSPISRSSYLRGSNSASTSNYSPPLRRSSSHFAPSSPSSSSTARFREPTIENTTATTTNALKRKYTTRSSPLASPSRSSSYSTSTISRSDTFTSEYDEGNPNKWTKQHWKKLEMFYLRKDRDYEKAASEFYYIESLQDILLPDRDSVDGKPIRKELWSKEQILWRCKCLDTSAKYHGGLLPSERKKMRKSVNTSPSSASTVTAASTSSESSSSTEKFRNLVNKRL